MTHTKQRLRVLKNSTVSAKIAAALPVVFIALSACSTPVTTLKHEKYGTIVHCGGEMTEQDVQYLEFTGIGGAYLSKIGRDKECVKNYEKGGYVIINDDTEPPESDASN